MHPLTKLALLGCALFIAYTPLWMAKGVPLLPPLAGCLVVVVIACEGWSVLRRWLLFQLVILAPVFLSLVLVQGFFFPGAEKVLLSLGPFTLKEEGLLFAAKIAGRLFLLTGATLLVLLTTASRDLALALSGAGVPRRVSYLFGSAVELLPRLRTRASMILDAQRARGLRTEGGLLIRIRSLGPLIEPLVEGALLEAEERALALESRAFEAPGAKSTLRQLIDTRGQRLFRWCALAGFFALLLWSRLS